MNRNHLLIILFLLSGMFTSRAQVIQRAEPPNWWTGMENPQLQLMIYGENIATCNVSISPEGLLQSVEKTENPNYLFLNLTIPNDLSPQTIHILVKKEGELIGDFPYELKERTQDRIQHQGFDPSDVIYLLMPDRFANGDLSNDSREGLLEKADRSNPDGRHGGDIQGIIDHLDYLDELGVTTLWINPLLENNQESYTYHGYAITDFYRVDGRFGDNAQYAELVTQAHQRGLKIVMDVVLNHCGINHWWMKDLPAREWIHQFDEYTQSNFRSPVLTDPYASAEDIRRQQDGWFDRNMPDLNQQHPLLATYLIQNTLWWIEYAGIDGIRLDTQPYADPAMVARWARAIRDQYPDFTILGEAWLQKIPITAYWQENPDPKDGYSSNIPVITDFPMHYAITKAFGEEQTWTEGMARLYYILAQDFVYADPSNTLVFLDNHDVTRIFSSLNKSPEKLKMAMAFQLTTRGIPSILYGTELLMEGYEHEAHGNMRKDFTGGWPEDQRNGFTARGRTDAQNEIYNYLQNLLTWRQNQPVIHQGELTHFIPEDNVYVYFRHLDKEVVMVILNNNDRQQTLDTERFREIMEGYRSGTEIITQTELKELDQIRLPKKSAMIIELKP
ncbi:MAG: glycoside hydrolase family 13 protein [Bacteroidales bacterium]|jgi:glycosidase|nr:glycoside hydrolase family 13 protein [Bacteroidales bacterium]